MPGPPPPPPPSMPGPPPMPNLNNNSSSKKSGGGLDMRGALLNQIQQGTKLKKVATVDKSGPLGAGRVAGSTNNIGNNINKSSPTKSYGSSTKTSPDSSTSSPIRQGGFSNLTEELQHKLTLKKNKNSPLKESKSIVETKESSPPSTITTTSKSFVNEIKSKQSVISPQHQPSSASSMSPYSSHTVNDAVPNKSSLFNNNNNNNHINTSNNINNISSKSSNNNINNNNSSYDNKSQPSAPKINYGKPNLAPKPPPPQLSLANNLNDVSRKSVARHQSMKSPRSPPVIPTTGPFTSDNHFGTIRNPSSHNKTQEALNLQVVHKPIAQRPTNKPPPPPIPNRNLGTNLTVQSHAKSTTALNNTHSDQNLSAPKRIANSGSSNNINSMDKHLDTTDSIAPPLPPHRMSSAQKLQQQQQQQQQQQSMNSQVPPEVPRRHSSMRASVDNGGNNRYPSPNPHQVTAPSKLVVDLESRYSLLFHSVSEFPAPPQFLNVQKSYPSKALGPPSNM